MKPDFTKIDYKLRPQTATPDKSGVPWMTVEGIPAKPFYTAGDLCGMEHLEYAAGLIASLLAAIAAHRAPLLPALRSE